MDTSAEQDVPMSRMAVFLHSNWSVVLLLGLCSYVTISGCLTAPLTQLDDATYITENPVLKPDQPWSRLITEHTYYQRIPVTMVSYRLNAELFGLDAGWAYRLVNLLFHTTSALLILGVLERLGLGRREALCVAVFWAVHPMACESVAWVSQRRNVLSFFFGILALYLYIRWSGRRLAYLLPPLAFALALFSSPLALGWLPLFVALEALGGPQHLNGPEQRWCFRPTVQAALRLLPLVLLSVLVSWMGMSGYARTMRPPPGGTAFTALLTDTDIFLRYLQNTLLPLRLSAMYGVDAIESMGDLRLWVNVGLWSVLVGGSIAVGRSRSRTVYGWLWFFGGLGPACNIVAIGYPMQDRYVYISSVGLFLVLVETVAGVAQRWPVCDRRWLRIILPLPCVLLYAFTAANRSLDWSDNTAMLRRAVETQPEAALSHIFCARQMGRIAEDFRLAGEKERAGESSRQAVQHMEKALSLPDAYLFNPLFAEIILARNLVIAGDPASAIKHLDGRLPAPDAPKLQFSNGPPCFSYVGSRFGFTYTLSRDSACEGYQVLADAYLQEFLDRPLSFDKAKPMLKSAASNSINALKVFPGSPDGQCLRACILLAEESFVRKDIPSEEALAEARDRARTTEPELRILSGTEAVREDLKKQVSLARIRALGCVGMARACFEPLLKRDAPVEQALPRIDNAIAWCQRAGGLDASLGIAFLYEARIRHFLFEAAQAQGAVDLMEEQRKACATALEKVPRESACYPLARKNLDALVAGQVLLSR